MKKLFLIIGAIAIFMVLVAGIGFYWVSASAMATVKSDAVSVVANGMARSIAKQTHHLTRIVQGITEREDVRELVKNKDIAGLEKISKGYEAILPGVKKIRILLPETTQIDTRQTPHLGYADLEMIRETFKASQQPVVQGDKGPNRHLAIAKGVVLNEKVAAVVLASLDYDYLKQSLRNAAANGGRIELKQGEIVLAGAGEAGEGDIKSETIKVEGTRWLIQSQTPGANTGSVLVLYTTVLVVVSIVIALLSLFGFKRMSNIIQADRDSLLKVTKDLVAGKDTDKYPTPNLGETQEVITEISQFIKGKDDSSFMSGSSETTGKAPEKELTIDDFFDDFDIDSTDRVSELTSNAVEQVGSKPMRPEDFLDDDGPPTQKPVAKVDNIHKSKQKSSNFGHTLSVEMIHKVGQAVGTELKEKGFGSVVLGRDGHKSNPKFYEALKTGLVSTGIDLLDIGRVTLPALYFTVQYQESKTGILLTGKDDSLEHSNIKILVDGELISKASIEKHQLRLDIGDFTVSDIAGVIDTSQALVNDYISAVKKEVKIARPMKVVIDCGNGGASALAPALLKSLDCEVTEINCDFDGKQSKYSANYNDPKILNELSTMVKLVQADIGFAIYGVGDRLGVVDAKGNLILADQQMMLYAKDVLKLIPGAKIIYDAMSSNTLAADIIKNGGKPILTKAKHAHIKRTLRKEGAELAGEMTGNFYFKDRWFGFDDALYSAARLLEIVSHKDAPTTDVFAELPSREHNEYYTIPMSGEDAVKFVAKLAEVAIFPEGKLTSIDCLRVDFKDGLGVAVPSQLTAAVEFRFEADNEEALVRIKNGFKQFMVVSKPGMKIPF